MCPKATSSLYLNLVESLNNELLVSVLKDVSNVFTLSMGGIRSSPNCVASFIFLQELKEMNTKNATTEEKKIS
jgi:hypothetical protein